MSIIQLSLHQTSKQRMFYQTTNYNLKTILFF